MKGIVKIEVAEKTKALWSPRTKAACERAQFKVNGDLLFPFLFFFWYGFAGKAYSFLIDGHLSFVVGMAIHDEAMKWLEVSSFLCSLLPEQWKRHPVAYFTVSGPPTFCWYWCAQPGFVRTLSASPKTDASVVTKA